VNSVGVLSLESYLQSNKGNGSKLPYKTLRPMFVSCTAEFIVIINIPSHMFVMIKLIGT
jgi:hypothetical protein